MTQRLLIISFFKICLEGTKSPDIWQCCSQQLVIQLFIKYSLSDQFLFKPVHSISKTLKSQLIGFNGSYKRTILCTQFLFLNRLICHDINRFRDRMMFRSSIKYNPRGISLSPRHVKMFKGVKRIGSWKLNFISYK